MNPGWLDAIAALAAGFAFAGLVTSGFEGLTGRRCGLAALRTGDGRALAHVPLLVLAAPLLIVRTAFVAEPGYRPNLVGIAVLTAIAGGWSLASGRLVLDIAGLAGAA